ncbi:MAG TPA: N-acetyltransferase [Mycobacterium sp.]|nr:N-acetyltransferase [Mycobacterium sp.]
MRLRTAVAADDAFLRRLCLDARPELQLLPPQLVDLQIAAQRTQYRRDHPQAVDEVVELDGDPVGRCWTADADGELHLLDFAVQADRRRQGIGRAVLDVVADRAAARGVAVRLAVWSTNADARRLYRAAGFTDVGEIGGHVVMRLAPGRHA